MDKGISVFFIQKPPPAGPSHTNTIPASGASRARPISPTLRARPSAATSTLSVAAPESVLTWKVPPGQEPLVNARGAGGCRKCQSHQQRPPCLPEKTTAHAVHCPKG